MKELTIEEKAQRYDEALDRAKKLYEQGTITECLGHVFPELKEINSEDDRMKKIISDILLIDSDDIREILNSNDVLMQDVNAWLEKQGEQILANSAKTCKDEQKSEWSEEDEKMFERALNMIEWYSCVDKGKSKPVSDWFKSLKDRVLPQPKQEWSEKDKAMLVSIISDFAAAHKSSIGQDNWLKSLRPQNSWKPSDGQMKALKEACDKHWEPDGLDPLYTLYQDLKKLREE